MADNKKYSWHILKPYPVSSDEKYNDKQDQDLLLLCKSIPDVLFQIFKTSQERTTIALRVPESYAKMVESIDSFESTPTIASSSTPGRAAVGTKIDVLITLKLAKRSAYPLIPDKNSVDRHIFSTFEEIPFGVFGIKLRHTTSRHITKQYESICRQNKQYKSKDSSKIDPYEKFAKAKSECMSFFYAQIFYGIKNIHDDKRYESFIPCFSKTRQPNSLIPHKRTVFTEKNREKASNLYEKYIYTKAKKTSMILSDVDLLPFVRFSENPYAIGHDSAQTPTTSNMFVDESNFKNLDEGF